MKTENKEKYVNLIKFLKENEEFYSFSVSGVIERAESQIFALELKNNFNLDINLNLIYSENYNQISQNMAIGLWDGKIRRIAWPIDGRQPVNEYLLALSFPTGSYIFSRDFYAKEIFKEFWCELLTYKPDYIDERNNALYWGLGKASSIFNSYDEIYNRYQVKAEKEKIEEKIKSLQEQLNELGN